jgi:hypothetical protein
MMWVYINPSSFLLLIMKLPKELRDKIYAYVAFGWAPDLQFPEIQPNEFAASNKEQAGDIGIARGPSTSPMYTWYIDKKTFNSPSVSSSTVICIGRQSLQLPMCIDNHRTPSWYARKEKILLEKQGLLDYFKSIEFDKIQQLVKALGMSHMAQI